MATHFYFNGHTYEIEPAQLTWADADTNATSLMWDDDGAFGNTITSYLVNIGSAAESAAILKNITASVPVNSTIAADGGRTDHLWIGTTNTGINLSGQMNALSGSDLLWSVVEWDGLIGTAANETLIGTSASDTIDGNAGNDVIKAGQGDDIVYMGDGNDNVTLGNGNNSLYGETTDVDSDDGDDRVTAGEGDNFIAPGTGDDIVKAGNGDNIVIGGSGNDKITTGSGNDIINIDGYYIEDGVGGEGDDTISTGAGDDYIVAGSGDDTVKAGDGDNTVIGGSGNDKITTGSGNDIINIDGDGDGIGGEGNDTISTGAGDDYIFAGSGNDKIKAGNGDDLIVLGEGFDTVWGGNGNDIFEFNEIPENSTVPTSGGSSSGSLNFVVGAASSTSGVGGTTVSTSSTSGSTPTVTTIKDFNAGTNGSVVDQLVLDSAVFEALSSTNLPGGLTTTSFLKGAGVSGPSTNETGIDDYLTFNTKTGCLYYDADGNGTESDTILVAVIKGKMADFNLEDIAII